VAIHPNTGSCRVIAAVFVPSVESGADYFAGPATIAQVRINFYCFNDFRFFLTLHG